eukprot:TRINITY_DN19213_c0_g1_i3.p1 TRINITY_DN19213_c0_g1~~TRINITY_DN19213_c0_g1_i3.p1  ORF type:complete len:319 (-),score=47.70 TRINITY_DN19213_c0_g1_i3:253-1209(-)
MVSSPILSSWVAWRKSSLGHFRFSLLLKFNFKPWIAGVFIAILCLATLLWARIQRFWGNYLTIRSDAYDGGGITAVRSFPRSHSHSSSSSHGTSVREGESPLLPSGFTWHWHLQPEMRAVGLSGRAVAPTSSWRVLGGGSPRLRSSESDSSNHGESGQPPHMSLGISTIQEGESEGGEESDGWTELEFGGHVLPRRDDVDEVEIGKDVEEEMGKSSDEELGFGQAVSSRNDDVGSSVDVNGEVSDEEPGTVSASEPGKVDRVDEMEGGDEEAGLIRDARGGSGEMDESPCSVPFGGRNIWGEGGNRGAQQLQLREGDE